MSAQSLIPDDVDANGVDEYMLASDLRADRRDLMELAENTRNIWVLDVLAVHTALNTDDLSQIENYRDTLKTAI